MKTKLFENIEGNRFRLLKESQSDNESYVASGLKKVFSNADGNISYRQVESVGMGYIRDINTAKRIALREARILAKEFGYEDNEDEAKFIKDSPNVRPLKKEEHDESNMDNPEEKREVQIGREILQLCNEHLPYTEEVKKIEKLAEELIKMRSKGKQTNTPNMSGWDNLQLGSH